MKTVSGSLVSSKPISLSKAASVLSSFVSAETGASQAVSAYLRRASDAFNELVQFHRELKAGRSERKRKKERLEIADNGNLTDAEINLRENGPTVERGRILNLGEEQSHRYRGNSEGGSFDGEERGKRVKNKKISDSIDYCPEVEDREGRDDVQIAEEKRKEKKKRKKAEVEDDGRVDGSEERHIRIKKKKRKHETEE
ncbi:PREDICTED: uncharacterized protein LOC104599327 [Nelumbo nucifera]|uniref:Uncharacterized protein LOC104599327 n=2 Tax=Nelumbo nucifera TaxID=4432 RepID=A0A1U8AD64_NELNU|nr:PREDICTED: uncharacterized protein LOC104599327 [Nelumbo nucifera]DAD27880.1 TPA_asm: hypothetical protein HUJ06_029348 [Nelumbo nucifera]